MEDVHVYEDEITVLHDIKEHGKNFEKITYSF